MGTYSRVGAYSRVALIRSITVSKQAMRQLDIIGPDFSALNASQVQEISGATASCGCLRRTKPPPWSDKLPFAAIPDNVNKMKKWILESAHTNNSQ